MKIAITAGNEGLDSPVDFVFGRARWFVLTDTETGQVEVHANGQNLDAAQGAGIQAARQLANRSVEVLLTGNVGPNAFTALAAASVKVHLFGKDVHTVRDALAAWKEGRLPEATAPTRKGHGM